MKILLFALFMGAASIFCFFMADKTKPSMKPIISNCDSLLRVNKILTHKYDSTRNLAIVNGFKIQRVKYYIKIVDRKPSQMKFFKGWIKRSIK